MGNKFLVIIGINFLLLTIIFWGAGAFIYHADWNSDQTTQIRKTEKLADFNRIVINVHGQVVIKHGEETKISTNGTKRAVENTDYKVRNNTLFVTYKPQKVQLFVFGPSIQYVITTPALENIKVQGTGDVQIDQLTGNNIVVNSSGTGNLSINKIRADVITINSSGMGDIGIQDIKGTKLNVHMSGAGDFNIKGNVTNQVVKKKGWGEYYARHLISRNSNIDFEGSGTVTIAVKESLKVKHYGIGDIFYYGKPQTDIDRQGIGQCRRLGGI